MLWLVPLTEGMTNEQIRDAANETYHQYFSSDVRDRYRVLDRFFDAFDSFDVLSLDLSCSLRKRAPQMPVSRLTAGFPIAMKMPSACSPS